MRIGGRRPEGVRSLGRATPAVEYDYNGMFKGLSNLGQFLGQMGQRIEQQEAASQYNDAWIRYNNEKNAYVIDSTSRPYAQVPNNPQDETAGFRQESRHTNLLPEYLTYEADLRAQIADTITSEPAREKFLESAALSDVKTRNGLGQEAIKWQRQATESKLLLAIEDHTAAGRWEDAEAAVAHGAALNLWTPEQQTRIARTLAGGQQVAQFEEGLQAVETRVEFMALRDSLKNEANSGWMTPAQRNRINAQINQKIEDSLVTALRSTVETQGIKVGKRFVQRANATSAEELGFESENDKYAAITRMQEVWGDYSWQTKTAKVDLEFQERKAALAAGAPADPRSKTDRKAINELWDESTADMDKWSEDWNRTLVTFASDKGWIPPNAESDIRAHLFSGDAPDVVNAATSMMAVQHLAPHAAQGFDKDDLAFGRLIVNNSRTGVPPADTIEKYRNDIYRTNDAIIKARERRFDTELAKDEGVRSTLEDIIDADPQADPTFRFAAKADDDMVADFGFVYRQEYARTGDKQSASQLAYQYVRNQWGLSNVGGSLNFQRYAPETMVPKGSSADGTPAPWVNDQFNADMESVGVNPDDVTGLVFNEMKPGNREWFVYKRTESGIIDLATDGEGNIVVWSPDYETSDAKAEADKVAAKAAAAAKQSQERTAHLAGEPSLGEKVYGPPLISGDDWKSMAGSAADAVHEGAITAWWALFEGIPEMWSKMPHKRFEDFQRKMKKYEEEFIRSGFPVKSRTGAPGENQPYVPRERPSLPKDEIIFERTYPYRWYKKGDKPTF